MKNKEIIPSISNLVIVFACVQHFTGHICAALAVVSALVYLRPYNSSTDLNTLNKIRIKIRLLQRYYVKLLVTKTKRYLKL